MTKKTHVVAGLGLSAIVALSLQAAAQTEITVGFVGTNPSGVRHDTLVQLIDQFNSENPDIKLTPIWMQQTSTGEGWDALFTRIAAGTAPDLQYVDVLQAARWASLGIIEPLDSFVKTGVINKGSYYPALTEAWTVNNSLVGIPTTGGPNVMFYNRTFMSEAGLSDPSADWTWSGEFLTDAKKLTVSDAAGTVKQYAIVDGPELQKIIMTSRANGVELFDRPVNPTKSLFTQGASVARFWTDLVTKYHVAPVSGKWGPERANVAFGVFGPWNLTYWSSQLKAYDWDLAPMPAGTAKRTTVQNSNGFVLIKDAAAHADQAALAKVVKFFSSPTYYANFVPAWRGLDVNQAFDSPDVPRGLHLNNLLDGLNYAQVASVSPYWSKLQQLAVPLLGQVIKGDIPFEQFAQTFDQQANVILQGK